MGQADAISTERRYLGSVCHRALDRAARNNSNAQVGNLGQAAADWLRGPGA